MKALTVLASTATLVMAMNAHATETVQEAPSAAIDRITLLYMNHKIYPSGAVVCDPKVVGARSVVGCWNLTSSGKSAPNIWPYEAGNFKSLNGSARQLAEGKFSNESGVSAMKLPLPADIDVGAVVESFK